MKKNFYVFITIILLIATVSVFAGCNKNIYTYEPCDDFFNLSVTFAGNGANTRAFSFMTKKGLYENKCVIQLDPASKEETEPSFNSKDNFEIIAESEPYDFFDETVTIQTAVASELTADTKYFYRAGSPEYESWSEWGSFITDDGDGSFSFLHITDSQSDNEEDYAAFAETMRKAVSENKDSEFILSTGDQTEHGYAQQYWNDFFVSINDVIMSNTFALVIGNHELFTQVMQANFYVPLSGSSYYYAYEYGNCLFMILDTNTTNFNEQLEWMSSVMSHSTKKWRIVAAHKSPYSTGTHADQFDVLAFKKAITPFTAQNSIDLVLGGHDHVYARTAPIDAEGNRAELENTIQEERNGHPITTYVKPSGTVYVVNRSTGNKFYNKVNDLNDHLIDKGDPGKISIPVYSLVKIEGNKLTYTAYEYYQNTKDTAVYDCFEIIK